MGNKEDITKLFVLEMPSGRLTRVYQDILGNIIYDDHLEKHQVVPYNHLTPKQIEVLKRYKGFEEM